MTDFVYLLHFSQPISDRHTAQHYLGSCNDVDARLNEHLAGKGARLTQVANERGIDYQVVRVWQTEPGQARQLERKLKNRKEAPALCPICAILRQQKRLQIAMPWADAMYDKLQFTLDDVLEMEF